MQTESLLNAVPCKQASLFAEPLLEVSSQASSQASSQTVQRRSSDALDHLAAAQRLAKKLRNGRRKPRTSKRAGIAICQHLIALLHEGEKHEGEKHEGEKHEGERHQGEARQREMRPRMNAESPRPNQSRQSVADGR